MSGHEWSLEEKPVKAAYEVFLRAYKRHPMQSDTYATFTEARTAAERAGASFADSSRVAVVAWDKLAAEISK